MNLARIKELKQYIDVLKNSRDQLIDIWMKNEDIDSILIKHSIDKNLFANDYAHPILSYFIGVVNDSNEIGNCPTIRNLLKKFKDKKISFSELYIICINFRKAIVKKFIQEQKLTEELYENVSYVFDENFKDVLEMFEHTVTKAKAETKRIYEDSIRDHLTNLFNRKKFDEILLEEISYSKSKNTPLSMILLDIDNFKNINDNYGHDVGDEVLIIFSSIIKKHIRGSDIVARWGGEEFVILMPKSTKKNSFIKSEQIRLDIQNYTFEKIGQITCSFGISQMKKDDDSSSIFNRADKALYLSKKNGKNMVTVS